MLRICNGACPKTWSVQDGSEISLRAGLLSASAVQNSLDFIVGEMESHQGKHRSDVIWLLLKRSYFGS